MSKATDMLDKAIAAEQMRRDLATARVMGLVERGEITEDKADEVLRRGNGRLEFLQRERAKEAAKESE
jgi:hypothetical protein